MFDAKHAARPGKHLIRMVRWFEPHEVLKMATSTNAELLAPSGRLNTHRDKLGVIEEDALADMSLIDGDPLENLKMPEQPEKHLFVIMKDGKLFKNAIK